MIESSRQLENARIKLRELEELYEEKKQVESSGKVHELTLRSLRKRINQFKEEIARFVSHSKSIASE